MERICVSMKYKIKNFHYIYPSYSQRISLSLYPGIANSLKFSYPLIGGNILSIVNLNASFNILGINFYNNGLLSSMHGFVLISINQTYPCLSTIKSYPNISN